MLRLLALVGVLATLAAPLPAVARRPALRGVVEGYYGRPWTGEARRDVIRFLGAHRLNAFLYAPKNDEFHRTRWREPYPASALADLRTTATAARKARVAFIYGLSPVLDVCYACDGDFDALTTKLAQVAGAGIRRFALLFDDGGRLTAPEDIARYGGTDAPALARAQADLVNRVGRALAARHRRLVLMVPSDYLGTDCHPYHTALAPALRRGLPVAWTGPGVFSATITAAQAGARAACLPGHPVILWDNYPANDTVLSNNVHLGPLTGRDGALPGALAGYLLNPMTEAHASLVALGTAARYLQNPRRYMPERAWARTLDELSRGGSGLAILAAQVRSSALDLDDARALADAVGGVAATYDGAEWSPAVSTLAAEETREAGAPEYLAGTALGDELAPWAAELATHAARGMDAVALLVALKPALTGLDASANGANLRVVGRALAPDFGSAERLGPGFASEAVAVAARIAAPPLGAYLACLGDLLGADIHFCSRFGLNVHGKALYILIHDPTDVSVVSDRNVHDRLVLLAGSIYAAWAARQGPGGAALAVTVNGAPALLAADGTFDVTVVGTRASVLVSTAAGDATARMVP
jgi:beta-N-acetylglucosaminidase-like protein